MRVHTRLPFNGPGAVPQRQFGVDEQQSPPPDPAHVRRIGFQGNLSTVLDRMTGPNGVGWFYRENIGSHRFGFGDSEDRHFTGE